MKEFNELTRAELANLGEIEIDAYVDIELANNNITKPIRVEIDYPNYLRVKDAMPEKDLTVYEADGHTFPDLESAQKYAAFLGSLPQVKLGYDWSIGGSDEKYAEHSSFSTPEVSIVKVYSQAKFQACRETIKHIRENRKNEKNENEKAVDAVIDYEAIDKVRYEIQGKVREAMQFFAKAKSVASDYTKYLSITNDEDKAFETLFTVYNVQDEDFKAEVRKQVSEAKTAAV